MAISGTATFNLDIADLAEEAYERAGLELKSSYDLRTTKRSINLLTLEWQNRGLDIWVADKVFLEDTPTVGQADYDLPIGTVEVLDVAWSQTAHTVNPPATFADYNLRRINQRSYAGLMMKLAQGRPDRYWVQMLEVLNTASDPASDTPSKISVFPTPSSSYAYAAQEVYTISLWRTRRIEDTGDPASNTMEIPGVYLPVLASGLAYRVGMKHPEAAPRLAILKGDYDEQLSLVIEDSAPNNQNVPMIPQQPQQAPQASQPMKTPSRRSSVQRSSGRRGF